MSRALLGRPVMWVHAFWIDGLLIDSGCHHTLPDLMAAIRQEGLTVEQLVNTHSHEDHVGANGWLHRRFGVRPQAHPLALERLARRHTPYEIQFYRRAVWGLVKEGSPGLPLGEKVQTDRYRFRVYHTPGHAPDHVTLFAEQEGWLFTGDLLVSTRIRLIRPEEDPLLTLDSLHRMAALPVRQLFCSHAYRVADSAQPLLEKAAYWEQLRDQAWSLSREGESLTAITRRLLPGFSPIELISWGDFARGHLIRGLLKEEHPEGR